MHPKRDIEVFGLSFLDMISCGLGGVIVLMLIFSSLADGGGDVGRPVHAAQFAADQGVAAPAFVVVEIDILPESPGGEPRIEPVSVGPFELRSAIGDKSGRRYLAVAHALAAGDTSAQFRVIPGEGVDSYRLKARLFSATWRTEVNRNERGEALLTLDALDSRPEIRLTGVGAGP